MRYYCANCGYHLNKAHFDKEMKVATCPRCHKVQNPDQLHKIEDKHKTQLAVIPPPKSNIECYRYSDSVLEITVPRKGFTKEIRNKFLYSILWMAAIVFFTFVAAQESLFLLLLAIPFWYSGLSMIYGVSKMAFEKQLIELNGNSVKIAKTRLLNSSHEEFKLRDIDSINMEKMAKTKQIANMAKIGKTDLKVPTIKHKGKTDRILEYGEEQEKAWVVGLLKEYMLKTQGEEL